MKITMERNVKDMNEKFAKRCIAVILIALAIYLVPKVPFLGESLGTLKNFALGEFYTVARTIASFGKYLLAIGFVLLIGGRMLAPQSGIARIGGVLMSFGMAIMILPSGNLIMVLIFVGIAIGLLVKSENKI